MRPALPIPEITLVTQPADTAAASATLDDLLASLPKDSMLRRLKLHRAVIGGQFVVSTTQQGIDDFRGGGPKLSADPAFLDGEEASGMPERDDRLRLREREGRAAAPRARGRRRSRPTCRSSGTRRSPSAAKTGT